jgi:hypothetical protein
MPHFAMDRPEMLTVLLRCLYDSDDDCVKNASRHHRGLDIGYVELGSRYMQCFNRWCTMGLMNIGIAVNICTANLMPRHISQSSL